MRTRELQAAARGFKRGLLDQQQSRGMCFVVSWFPLRLRATDQNHGGFCRRLVYIGKPLEIHCGVREEIRLL